jgi:hypothetical protein
MFVVQSGNTAAVNSYIAIRNDQSLLQLPPAAAKQLLFRHVHGHRKLTRIGSPLPQALDGLAHGHGEGNGLVENLAQVEFAGLAVFGKGPVQGLDEGGFDLGSGGE